MNFSKKLVILCDWINVKESKRSLFPEVGDKEWNNRIYAYADSQQMGRSILLRTALYRFPEFVELIIKKQYQEAAELLLAMGKTREDFRKIFGTAGDDAYKSPYWHGSHVKAMLDTFWQMEPNDLKVFGIEADKPIKLPLNLLDFKLPRQAEIIFDKAFAKQHGCRSGKYFILDQVKEKYVLKTDEEAIYTLNVVGKTIRRKERKLHGREIETIFSDQELDAAKQFIVAKHGSVRVFNEWIRGEN